MEALSAQRTAACEVLLVASGRWQATQGRPESCCARGALRQGQTPQQRRETSTQEQRATLTQHVTMLKPRHDVHYAGVHLSRPYPVSVVLSSNKAA